MSNFVNAFCLYMVNDVVYLCQEKGSVGDVQFDGYFMFNGLDEITKSLPSLAKEGFDNHYCVVVDEAEPQKENYKNICIYAFKSALGDHVEPAIIPLTQEGNDISTRLRSSAKNAMTSIIGAKIKDIKFQQIIDEKKTKYLDLSKLIHDKAKNLQDRGFANDAGRAKKFIEDLDKLADEYFNNPSEEAYVAFKANAHDIITNASNDLNHHRDWNYIFANVALAIIGFGVLYAVAVAINGNIFFASPKSVQLLDKFDSSLMQDNFQVSPISVGA